MIEAKDRTSVVSPADLLYSYRKEVYRLGSRVNKLTRLAIKAMLMCGMTYEAIAEELDISERSVYLLDHRAF